MSKPNSSFNTHFCCFPLTSFHLPLHDAKMRLHPDHLQSINLSDNQTEKLYDKYICISINERTKKTREMYVSYWWQKLSNGENEKDANEDVHNSCDVIKGCLIFACN